jgi:hypothetical protein
MVRDLEKVTGNQKGSQILSVRMIISLLKMIVPIHKLRESDQARLHSFENSVTKVLFTCFRIQKQK